LSRRWENMQDRRTWISGFALGIQAVLVPIVSCHRTSQNSPLKSIPSRAHISACVSAIPDFLPTPTDAHTSSTLETFLSPSHTRFRFAIWPGLSFTKQCVALSPTACHSITVLSTKADQANQGKPFLPKQISSRKRGAQSNLGTFEWLKPSPPGIEAQLANSRSVFFANLTFSFHTAWNIWLTRSTHLPSFP
jgi:hypothetical protein